MFRYKKPLISVLITNYNKSKWINYCLKSLTNQSKIKSTYYELIIIDDNSTDKSKKYLKNYSKNKHIKILFNKKNLGLPKSLNKAIKKSKGKFIIRVDIDDTVNKNFLNEFKKMAITKKI